ncbi:hypothetical protein ABEK21_27130, partial [Klebsiella pneumoniae]
MMSLWDALRMNMMISYQELVRTFPNTRAKKMKVKFLVFLKTFAAPVLKSTTLYFTSIFFLGANLFIEVKREYPTKKGTIMIVTVTAISLIGNINKSDKLRV